MAEIKVDIDDSWFKGLQKRAGGASKVDIVKEALALYNWALEQSQTGRFVVAVDNNWENPARVGLPLIERSRKVADTRTAA